jgi:hypothetical protein
MVLIMEMRYVRCMDRVAYSIEQEKVRGHQTKKGQEDPAPFLV